MKRLFIYFRSYLSPIKVFNTNKQITNQKSIHMSKKKKNKSIIQLAEEEQLNEYEYINLTPLVSRIALKLTKRKQLKLPKDKSFLFQFIDPLPQSLKRICKEEEIKKNQKNNTSSSSYNKRLVLTIEQEKKCEKDTILRLNDYLLPLLTRVVKTSQASKHMRSGSILNFNKANIFDLKTISNQLSNETNNNNNNNIGIMKVKIPKDKKEGKHNAFNSARSVVVLNTPSVNYSDISNDEIITPQPNDINNLNNHQINSNDILYDVDEEDEDDDDDDDDSSDTQSNNSNDSINQSYANYTQKHNNNYNDEEKHIIYNDSDDDDNESEQEHVADLAINDPGDIEPKLEKSHSSQSVRVHKQFSTKDYGTYGYGNDGKNNIETNKKDTLLIKVEQIPPKVNDKKLEINNKHIKNKKSNSDNSVIENW